MSVVSADSKQFPDITGIQWVYLILLTQNMEVTQKPQGECSIPEDSPRFKCFSQVCDPHTGPTQPNSEIFNSIPYVELVIRITLEAAL